MLRVPRAGTSSDSHGGKRNRRLVSLEFNSIREDATMKPQPFVVTPDRYARALNVVGEKITVLASNAATQGYEIFLQQGDEPGLRPTATTGTSLSMS